MRNVTISLDEDTLRWARIRAAEQDTSVSRLVAELLEQERAKNDEYADAMNRYFAATPILELGDDDAEYWAAKEAFFAIPPWQVRDDPSKPYPAREEIYDRPVLRRHERPGVQQGSERADKDAAVK